MPDKRRITLGNINKFEKIIKSMEPPKISKGDKMPHEEKIERGKKILREKLQT